MTEWKKGISDKEIEKTDKMIDDLIDMIVCNVHGSNWLKAMIVSFQINF